MSRKYFLILQLEVFLFSCSFCSSVGCLVIVLYKLALVKKRKIQYQSSRWTRIVNLNSSIVILDNPPLLISCHQCEYF